MLPYLDVPAHAYHDSLALVRLLEHCKQHGPRIESNFFLPLRMSADESNHD